MTEYFPFSSAIIIILYAKTKFYGVLPFLAGSVAIRFWGTWYNSFVEEALSSSTRIAFLSAFIVLLSYSIYPSYLGHLDSTVATLGVIFQNDGIIYPDLDDFTFHGLLYGPAVAEIQALSQSMGLPLIFSVQNSGHSSLLPNNNISV